LHIKTFSYHLSEHACIPALSSCLANAHGHADSTQGLPFDILSLVAKGAGIPELHGNVAIGKIVLGSIPSPGHCTDSSVKNNTNLPVKKAYLLSLGIQVEGQASGIPHI